MLNSQSDHDIATRALIGSDRHLVDINMRTNLGHFKNGVDYNVTLRSLSDQTSSELKNEYEYFYIHYGDSFALNKATRILYWLFPGIFRPDWYWSKFGFSNYNLLKLTGHICIVSKIPVIGVFLWSIFPWHQFQVPNFLRSNKFRFDMTIQVTFWGYFDIRDQYVM